jgi:hypothetical protein
MLGRVLVAIAGGVVLWKYRDTVREYMNGNAAPARDTIDRVLRTVQEKSEVLLDQAKEQVSSRLESARERVRAGGRAEEGSSTAG